MRAVPRAARAVLNALRQPPGRFLRRFAVEVELGGPADVAAFAALEPHPRSVQYLTSTVDPVEISRFLQTEMPIRYAERIRSLEHVPHWKEVRNLVEVHQIHTQSFEAFRKADLPSFAQVSHEAILREQVVVELLAKSVHQLRREFGETIKEEFVPAEPFLSLPSRAGAWDH
ncbi:unnamed protein product [Durusdinium trenchii]|uniref:Branched-chain alpha-ketoacid dehydrogenase kinase/Pyruvate dehydrogenase kinase N-terminal domain-containing protein n=1 Tax=Durusdinium trenchii TaxID=1381693 RepID=A0ABP0IGV2_9DINO